MADKIEIRGSVQSILFGPAEDGFTLLAVRDERGERVVVAGRSVLTGIGEGDEVSVEGRWQDSKHGPRLNAYKARKSMPRTEAGLRKWLAKAKIPSVGEIKAGKLVDRFGLNAVRAIVDGDPDAVTIIGRKRHQLAAAALASKQHEAEVGATLAAHDIGASVQRKIWDRYQGRTHDILTKDPYRLIIDIEGVAFTTADRIAKAAGLPENSPSRIRAGIIETLREASTNGDCALYHAQLIERCRQRLYVSEDLIEAELAGLQPRQIVSTTVRGLKAWALAKLNATEREFARHLVRKLRDEGVQPFGETAVIQAVDQACINLGISLNEKQREAAIMALRERISILTGGPGTGKTLTLRVICEAWRLLAETSIKKRGFGGGEERHFALAAPTGKAAKRITETTGFEAKTIHRLLEYKPEFNGFDRNQGNPLLYGMICIDESSMPDILIANDLARAWGQARVLLIGDIDQLPSVGPGKVLADMLASGVVPHVKLTEIWRQAAGSAIAIGADAIRLGKRPESGLPGKSDLVHIPLKTPVEIADRIVEMYVDRLPSYLAREGLDPASIQVLCPGKQTEVGTIALNKAIQERLRQKREPGLVVGLCDKMEGGRGDIVIQLENDYDRNIFNGDTGRILDVEKGLGGELHTHVDFGGTVQTFEGKSLQNLALSYALTIHKSQGSEYQAVIIPVTTNHYTLLRRTLLYTGVTRAKRLCILVGTDRAIMIAINTEDSSTRVTTLVDAILEEAGEGPAGTNARFD